MLRTLRDGRLPEEVIRDRVRLVKGFFDQTLPLYHGRVALLHLDCDLYESYRVALLNLYQKVVPGGVIMFDENGDNRWPGATKAIDEFLCNKPEQVEPHAKCHWKYFLIKS